MATGKAKVIIKVGDDFYRIAENIWKIVKGSKGVNKSSQKAATNAGRNPKNASRKTIELKSQAEQLKRANKQKEAADALRRANKKTENIKFKKEGPLDAGKKTKRKKPDDKKQKEPEVKSETISTVGLGGVRSTTVIPKVKRKGGFILTPSGKPFTNKAKWLAAGGLGSWAAYVAATSGSKKPNGASSGAGTKPKPSKQPSGPPSVYSPPFKKKPSTTRVADDDLETKAPKADPKVAAKLAKPKTFEQKLKAKWVKSRGGEPAFGKKGSEGAGQSHLFDMREGSEAGLTYTDQQNYEKIMEERKGATKKKYGGIIKRNKGGAVRGVGKALRGYGNNSIYSNKMY